MNGKKGRAEQSKERRVEHNKGNQKKRHLGFKGYIESSNEDWKILREAKWSLKVSFGF